MCTLTVKMEYQKKKTTVCFCVFQISVNKREHVIFFEVLKIKCVLNMYFFIY